jgi:hypothetical protein
MKSRKKRGRVGNDDVARNTDGPIRARPGSFVGLRPPRCAYFHVLYIKSDSISHACGTSHTALGYSFEHLTYDLRYS